MSKLSFTYRFLRFMGFKYSEGSYGQVSVRQLLNRVFATYRNSFLTRYVMRSWLLSPFLHKKVRPWSLKMMGAKIGNNVFIGDNTWIDTSNAELIEIGDDSHVDACCILLCHKRDLSNYFVGDDYTIQPYHKNKIVIGKHCSVGTGSMIMPGVTIGDGVIIGAYSLVTKDIPSWTIAIGRPAKVVRKIPVRKEPVV